MTVLDRSAKNSTSRINTAATTQVKAGSGVLHAVICGTPVASASITIYDSLTASGTVLLATVLPATLVGEGPNSTASVDIAFTTGLTIATVGTADWTIVWR